MRTVKALVVAAVLLAGCGLNLPTLPAQERATRIVWLETYGMGTAPAPTVQWMVGAQLNCLINGVPVAFTDPNYDKGETCLAGLYHTELRLAQVALVSGEEISDTAFTHELYHSAKVWRGEDDPLHMSAGWKPGGELERANDALRKDRL